MFQQENVNIFIDSRTNEKLQIAKFNGVVAAVMKAKVEGHLVDILKRANRDSCCGNHCFVYSHYLYLKIKKRIKDLYQFTWNYFFLFIII